MVLSVYLKDLFDKLRGATTDPMRSTHFAKVAQWILSMVPDDESLPEAVGAVFEFMDGSSREIRLEILDFAQNVATEFPGQTYQAIYEMLCNEVANPDPRICCRAIALLATIWRQSFAFVCSDSNKDNKKMRFVWDLMNTVKAKVFAMLDTKKEGVLAHVLVFVGTCLAMFWPGSESTRTLKDSKMVSSVFLGKEAVVILDKVMDILRESTSSTVTISIVNMLSVWLTKGGAKDDVTARVLEEFLRIGSTNFQSQIMRNSVHHALRRAFDAVLKTRRIPSGISREAIVQFISECDGREAEEERLINYGPKKPQAPKPARPVPRSRSPSAIPDFLKESAPVEKRLKIEEYEIPRTPTPSMERPVWTVEGYPEEMAMELQRLLPGVEMLPRERLPDILMAQLQLCSVQAMNMNGDRPATRYERSLHRHLTQLFDLLITTPPMPIDIEMVDNSRPQPPPLRPCVAFDAHYLEKLLEMTNEHLFHLGNLAVSRNAAPLWKQVVVRMVNLLNIEEDPIFESICSLIQDRRDSKMGMVLAKDLLYRIAKECGKSTPCADDLETKYANVMKRFIDMDVDLRDLCLSAPWVPDSVLEKIDDKIRTEKKRECVSLLKDLSLMRVPYSKKCLEMLLGYVGMKSTSVEISEFVQEQLLSVKDDALRKEIIDMAFEGVTITDESVLATLTEDDFRRRMSFIVRIASNFEVGLKKFIDMYPDQSDLFKTIAKSNVQMICEKYHVQSQMGILCRVLLASEKKSKEIVREIMTFILHNFADNKEVNDTSLAVFRKFDLPEVVIDNAHNLSRAEIEEVVPHIIMLDDHIAIKEFFARIKEMNESDMLILLNRIPITNENRGRLVTALDIFWEAKKAVLNASVVPTVLNKLVNQYEITMLVMRTIVVAKKRVPEITKWMSTTFLETLMARRPFQNDAVWKATAFLMRELGPNSYSLLFRAPDSRVADLFVKEPKVRAMFEAAIPSVPELKRHLDLIKNPSKYLKK